MKKQVLLTVFAAALFAAPVASANNGVQGEQFGNGEAPNLFDNDGNLTGEAHAGATNHYRGTTLAKNKKANGNYVEVKPGEFVFKGKAPVKTPGKKVLPKTSAAK